jgi:hypothetical protein
MTSAQFKAAVTVVLTFLRQIYAYLGTAESILNVGGLQGKIRLYLIASAGPILIFEHVLQAIQSSTKTISTTTTYVPPPTEAVD